MSGRGVEATLDGTRLAVGGPDLLRDRGLEVPADLREEAAAWRSRGASVLYLVRDGTVVGAFALRARCDPRRARRSTGTSSASAWR